MNIKQLHTLLLVVVCAALAACTDDQYNPFSPDPNSGKTPIELSIGGVDAQGVTRAVITDDNNKTYNAFSKPTKIFMVMKSEYGTEDYEGSHTTKYTVTRGDVDASSNVVKFDTYNQKYWDDAHARSSQLSIWAYAQQDIPEQAGWLKCTFEDPNPSWDGQDPLTEYKEATFNTYQNPNPWIDEVDGHDKGAIYPCIMTWKASHNTNRSQDNNSIKYQDLLFSNNLVNYDTDSEDPDPSKNKSLQFNFDTRKFPQSGEAQMNFYHAMSKITIHIKKGEGFSSFSFTNGNVCLKKLNNEGTFNIKDGEFQQVKATCDDIPQIYVWNTPASGYDFTLEALAIPNIHDFLQSKSTSLNDPNSRFVKDAKNLASDVMMEFTINNNKYQITSGQLYDALKGKEGTNEHVYNDKTYIPLEAGKNYVFSFTIGKTKIDYLTAQVADWENIEADPQTPTNARIRLQLEDRGSALTNSDAFSLYRAADNIADSNPFNDSHEVYNWTTGYNTTGVTPSFVAAADPRPAHWETTWFWDSNKHFYHFRALAKDNGTNKVTVSPVSTDGSNGDYLALTSASTYNDILWGAPFKDVADSYKFNYGPTTNGFDGLDSKAANDHQIYKAIGATEDPVKLILFHMMSDLTFNIKTTSGTDAVTLVNGGNKTKVEIVDFYSDGKVLLGNGLVKTTNSTGTQEVAWNSESPSSTHVYKYGAVPQLLTGVKLRITTPDNNQYIVDLATAKVASDKITSNNLANPYHQGSDGKYTINRWYPGFKYNYTFTLKKSGITDITATIVDWETVKAGNEDVQIK